MLVVSTTSLTLADGTKQIGLVGCSDSYLSKLCLGVIFFKVNNLYAYLYMYK